MTTDPTLEARLAALRRERAATPPDPAPPARRRSPFRRRRHVAVAARRLATGAAATGVLSLVAVMGLARTAPAPTPAPAVVVVPGDATPGPAGPTGSVAVPRGDRPTTAPATRGTTADGSTHGSR